MEKKETATWWVMAKSCLPRSCSSCACSTWYHFVPPSLATFSEPLCITLRMHNAASSLPGKPSPTETPHDSTGWGRRDGRCGFGPVRSPGCIRPLALPQHAASSVTHTHAQTKHTKLQYICAHIERHKCVHEDTQSGRNKWTESKSEKRIPNLVIHSYHLNQCACD